MKSGFRIWFIAILFMAVSAWGAERTVHIDGVAAYVDNDIITVGDVRDAIEPVVMKLKKQYQGQELAEQIVLLYRRALNDLIERRLILKAFDKTGGKIPDRIVERRINELIHDRFNDDRGSLLEALQNEHMTYEQWREQVREQIIVASMRKYVTDQKVVISPEEIRKVYEANKSKYEIPEKIKLSLIMIHGAESPTDNEPRKKLAESTQRKAQTGEERFSDLAIKVSEDGKGPQGGDWGWIEPTDLRPELRQAVATLKAGEVSPVVVADNDYFVLKLEERKAAGITPFNEAQWDIEKELRRKETARIYDLWLERQKKEYHVKIYEMDGKL